MNRRLPFVLLSSLALAGCGDASSGAALRAAGGAGAGAAGAGGSAGGAGAGGAGGTAPGGGESFDGQTLTLTMATFAVPAGAEVYKCQNFGNPFGGQDVDVSGFESHMTPGSHHLLLFYKANATDSPIMSCSGLEFAATPYGTQIPDDAILYPPGIGALVPKTDGFRVQAHYLNTTQEELSAVVTVTLHVAPPGTVTEHAGQLFFVQTSIIVAPHSTSVVSDSCHLPFDLNVLSAGSHMHKHGTAFEATLAGQPLYQTTTWDEPKPASFSPPIAAKAGDPVDFSCTFQNDTSDTLTFGESALSDEMCIFVGQFYPVPAGSKGTVGCQ